MEIISVLYAILSILAIYGFYLLNPKYRIVYLTILSCCLIASYHHYLLIYVIIFSLLNYIIGIKIPDSPHKTTLFRIGIIFNLLQLILLKYASFAIDPFFQLFNSKIHISKLSELIIPLGISYFTLQGIGYLINVKMGWEKPEKKLFNFILYIIFYPKFLSGPIERSNHFLPQLTNNNPFNEQQVTKGLKIALLGFFKKVVIANQLGMLVTGLYTDLSFSSTGTLWIILLIQPLYLYFDFSGYTDIAVGLAKTFGIDLLQNFNKPFLSENVTTFWKRFHMSLSFWFNDYIFKQVSFRYRKLGKYAAVLAIFATFTLFGIWHGAGWNFMVLGFIQALAINFEFFTKKIRSNFFYKMPDFWRLLLSRLITYVFFGFSLILFFSPNLSSAINFYDGLFLYRNVGTTQLLLNTEIMACVLAVIFLLFEYINQDHKELSELMETFWFSNKFVRVTIYFTMVFLILTFIGRKLSFVYQAF